VALWVFALHQAVHCHNELPFEKQARMSAFHPKQTFRTEASTRGTSMAPQDAVGLASLVSSVALLVYGRTDDLKYASADGQMPPPS